MHRKRIVVPDVVLRFFGKFAENPQLDSPWTAEHPGRRAAAMGRSPYHLRDHPMRSSSRRTCGLQAALIEAL